MLNHLRAKVAHLRLSASDVVAQTAPQSFDISIWQFLAPLLVGAAVRIVAEADASDPARLWEEARRGVTILEVVPSMLRLMLDVDDGRRRDLSLRALVVTGEPIAPATCRRWLQLYPGVPIVNAYGPTECSDDVTHHDMPTVDVVGDRVVPAGRPIPGAAIHIVNDELCVGGAPVGRGYLGAPGLTAAAFVPDPFGAAGSRMYRTGDRARRAADGAIELLGRLDDQVKVRGCRVELSTVEAVLTEHASIRQAAVIAKDLGADSHLVAFVVTTRECAILDVERYVAERLPAYMVPTLVVRVDALPLTSNGKVDRRALITLPLPEKSAGEPMDLEAHILAIWRRTLGAPRIGLDTNFFDAGGDSVLLARLRRELEQSTGRDIPAVDFYAHPTVRTLANALRGANVPSAMLQQVAARAAQRARSRGRR
jgi:acyl-coenzyme A synthetase/AMP-(fatty) acid ligase